MTNKSLEELLIETEEKILNKDYYKQCTLTYEGEEYSFFIKPISQAEFMKIYRKYGSDDILGLNEALTMHCIVHEDGTNYDKKLIQTLLNGLPAGFTNEISSLIYEVSGIQTNEEDIEKAKKFLA